MATEQMTSVLRHLRRAALLPDGGGLSDGELLESFLVRQEEAAFEALVRRHGQMVLGVCRRILHHTQDAEDAFQATFLVLIRKAASIVPRERIGNWLHGVAYRTALKARTQTARRRVQERRAAKPPWEEARAEAEPDWRPLLDRELSRLPGRYRAPVVLSDLEGQSRRQIARQLGLPEGTVSSRLARGRRMLADRLARRGLTLSAGALAAALASSVASASVPTSLTVSTLNAATLAAAGEAAGGLISAQIVALMEGVLKAMWITKLKIATIFLLAVGLAGLGAGALKCRLLPDKPGETAQAAGEKQVKDFPLPHGDVLGFTGKGGQPYALERDYPGLNGALLLTEEQKRQISTAWEKTLGSQEVRDAGMKVKSDPSATEARKEAARKLLQDARTNLNEQVAKILTHPQKVLVEQINAAVMEVQKAVLEDFTPQFAAAKGNEAQTKEVQKEFRDKVRTELNRKLEAILNAEQKAAYEKAATAQKAAEEAAKNYKKPGK